MVTGVLRSPGRCLHFMSRMRRVQSSALPLLVDIHRMNLANSRFRAFRYEINYCARKSPYEYSYALGET